MSLIDPDGRERDRLGRVQPHRINAVGLASAIPGLLAQFSEKVPPRFYGGGRRGVPDRCVVAIRCPGCQSRAQIVQGRIFHPCPGCTRWFLELGGRVRCAALPPEQDLSEAA